MNARSAEETGRSAWTRRAVLGDIKGGLVASVVCLGFSVANGALIYSGAMSSLLSFGILAGLLTTAVSSIVIALMSGFRPVISSANSTTAAPLGAIMASIAPALARLPAGTAAATVFMLVAVTSLMTGLVIFLLGLVRMGKIVRFFPFPVVAGFMGVTGTLLLLGALRFGTGIRIVSDQLPKFLVADNAALLALTIAFAAFVTFVTRRFKNPLALPVVLLFGILAADGLNAAAGYSLESPALRGLFLLAHRDAALVPPIVPRLPWLADWSLILPLAGPMAAYVVLVILATLLTSTGLESALNIDANYDRELRAQGLGCIASGLCGGFVGNPTVGPTTAAVGAGAGTKLAGIVQGLAMLGIMLIAIPVIPYVPRFVIGGYLAHMGFGIIMTWCVATRKKMPRGEWFVVIAIVAITVWTGLVPAVIAGLIFGCIIFALDVSRLHVVQRDYGLDSRTSLFVRPTRDMTILARDGDRIRFVELSGMLFFGSAYQILARVRRLLAERRPDMIIVDLTRVLACDSSATAVMARMRRLLLREGVAFAVAGGNPEMILVLRSAGCLMAEDAVYPDRNCALEASETRVLGFAERDAANRDLRTWLTQALDSRDLADALIVDLACHDYEPGSCICRQGEPADRLFFIETGRVDVIAGSPGGQTRVRVFGPCTVAGEHAFIFGSPRSATLRAEQSTRLWTLTSEAFERIVANNPALGIALLRNIIRDQSERLGFATRQNAILA